MLFIYSIFSKCIVSIIFWEQIYSNPNKIYFKIIHSHKNNHIQKMSISINFDITNINWSPILDMQPITLLIFMYTMNYHTKFEKKKTIKKNSNICTHICTHLHTYTYTQIKTQFPFQTVRHICISSVCLSVCLYVCHNFEKSLQNKSNTARMITFCEGYLSWWEEVTKFLAFYPY